ncbi:MAG: alpha/beta hydrolase [Alphaproteobacteria bacterium]|nr:alpha/beta hydrolase [Alphaproteobacteria bacterium]
MPLLRREDYPDQLPRPEPVLEFQKELWDRSRDIEGVDIAWGDDIYQRIAIYPAPEPNGAVFAFIHGGRWTSGHKEAMAFMAPAFHDAGITFASLGHRLAPSTYDDGFPDLCNGIACLVANADRHGGDAQRVFVGGHSSGGHYAAQLAVTRDWQARHGLARDVIKGCLPISGVYDVSSDSDMGDWPPPCLAEGDDGREKSPLHRIAETPPPFLVTWGSDDYPFLIPQGKEFAQALKEAGCDVEELQVPGKTHFSILGESAAPGGEWSEHAVAWIERH